MTQLIVTSNAGRSIHLFVPLVMQGMPCKPSACDSFLYRRLSLLNGISAGSKGTDHLIHIPNYLGDVTLFAETPCPSFICQMIIFSSILSLHYGIKKQDRIIYPMISSALHWKVDRPALWYSTAASSHIAVTFCRSDRVDRGWKCRLIIFQFYIWRTHNHSGSASDL